MTIPNVVILTGAGISAESGLATFRGSDGLWEGHRIQDVASPEGFESNPALVHQFYNMRRAALQTVQPNAAHQAVARLQEAWGNHVMLITQNVDDLHERGGSNHVLHMHGEVLKARCTRCGHVTRWRGDLDQGKTCPACENPGFMRPDVVWFGEMPYGMDEIHEALAQADAFVSIGTSGNVYPAAEFVQMAVRSGATTIEINLVPSLNAHFFDHKLSGPAGVEVPRWVEGLLGAANPLPRTRPLPPWRQQQ